MPTSSPPWLLASLGIAAALFLLMWLRASSRADALEQRLTHVETHGAAPSTDSEARVTIDGEGYAGLLDAQLSETSQHLRLEVEPDSPLDQALLHYGTTPGYAMQFNRLTVKKPTSTPEQPVYDTVTLRPDRFTLFAYYQQSDHTVYEYIYQNTRTKP